MDSKEYAMKPRPDGSEQSIDLDDDHAIRNWAQKTGRSVDAVREAVRLANGDPGAVRERLRGEGGEPAPARRPERIPSP